MRLDRGIIFLLALILGSISAQIAHPADSLLKSPNVSLFRQFVITPIALWQRLSYSNAGYNCQFYPSCSNYSALSIARHGITAGIALTSDRIIRCNPFAHDYHIRSLDPAFHRDGRLVDSVPKKVFDISNGTRSSLLAAGFSAVVPGMGRLYAGRGWDGLFGFVTVSALANITYRQDKLKHDGTTFFFGGLTIIFYLGEIIGAYRAAVTANNRP